MRRGDKVTFATTPIATTSTNIGLITGCRGACGVLIRGSGGDVGNLLNAVGLVGLEAGATVPPVAGNGMTPASGQFVVGTFPKVNGTVATDGGGLLWIYFNQPWPTQNIYLALGAATGTITGAVIEAWPLFDQFAPDGNV